jgi:myo-inositol-1(or 4)-monophosphatase
VERGRTLAGAVEAPFLGLSFWGVRGGGAWRDARRLHVSRRPVGQAVVSMAFPFRRKSLMARYGPVLERVLAQVEDLRRPGSAALDLAWVASGVFDGYFELNLSEWDLAAGTLLVEEAGGVVTDWEGGPRFLGGEVLAGSPTTHAALLDAVMTTGAASP